MAFNFVERLGSMLGQSVVERLRGKKQDEAAPPEAAVEAPTPEAAPVDVQAAPEDAHAAPVETTSEPVAYAEPTAEPAAEAAPDAAPTVDTYAAPAAVPSTPEATPAADEISFAPPTEAAAEAPAEPAKSEEELEEERLWGDVEVAWGGGDFQRVTESLDRLRELQPEDSALIDEKIAAAQYNQASAFEQTGDLDRALYLYQEAQRRNPTLGEASFAIERIQAQLQPAAASSEAAPAPEAAAPVEQSYTVAAGDNLSAIAEQFYGAADQWPRIFEANRDKLDNPDLIYPGQVLRIPT